MAEARDDLPGVLHVAVALCVLNDTFREGRALDVEVHGVQVPARGEFDEETWQSTGVTHEVQLDSPASPGQVEALTARVDAVAEVPRALRAGMTVERAAGADGIASMAEPERSGRG